MKCRQRIFLQHKAPGSEGGRLSARSEHTFRLRRRRRGKQPGFIGWGGLLGMDGGGSSLPEKAPPLRAAGRNRFRRYWTISSIEPYWLNSLIVYGDMVLEPFQSSETAAANYAKVVSDIKQALGEVKVYNMVVPTHVEFALPERFRGAFSDSQRGTLDAVYNGYTADVAGVDIYDILSLKKREYLYFNTDHHWTGLAAYYAYTEFAKAAGFEPIAKEEMEKEEHPGAFGGRFMTQPVWKRSRNIRHGGILPAFRATTLAAPYAAAEPSWNPPCCCTSTRRASTPTASIWAATPPCLWSGTRRPICRTRKKIAVIKESFGNAFAPYLAPHYSEVHIIDLRYFKENLASYVEENGSTRFLSSITSKRPPVRVCRTTSAV